MAGVAGSVTGAAAHALTGGARAVEIEIGGDARHEGGEAVGIADTLAQSVLIGVVGLAKETLAGVQLVGTRLALVQPETGVRLWAVRPRGFGNGWLLMVKVRPMPPAGGWTGEA
ncbi:hypothetical protein FHW96_001567 [Novosphingobium sp. SG751A]|uniref:hypothetical protein n=1 Tax=Novosphingobium sp. SG751A TaxID=2587000 RepID=UPI001554083D|nr:hypothetical protein [Novosphingobium sp. SG751A]NOW45412.1 hypothetical protein [Novosphingobium sp. SG751A]